MRLSALWEQKSVPRFGMGNHGKQLTNIGLGLGSFFLGGSLRSVKQILKTTRTNTGIDPVDPCCVS